MAKTGNRRRFGGRWGGGVDDGSMPDEASLKRIRIWFRTAMLATLGCGLWIGFGIGAATVGIFLAVLVVSLIL